MPPASRKRRKWPYIVLAVVAVLVVGVGLRIGYLAANGVYPTPAEPSREANSQQDSQQQPKRPDRIAVFDQSPGQGTPHTYGGTVLYDACEILPLEALPKLGLAITPELVVIHQYFDGDVPAPAIVKQDALARSSSCTYGVPNGARVSVDMYQPPFSDDRQMEANRPDPEDGPISTDRKFDVITYRDDRVEQWVTTISRPHLIVEAQVHDPTGDISGWDGRAIAEALRGPLVSRTLAGPAPHRLPSYNSGYEGAKNPCDAFPPSALEAAFHKPAAPHAVAVFQVGDSIMYEFDGSVAFRIDASCTRHSLVDEGRLAPDYVESKLGTSYWQDERGAETRQQAECRDTVLGIKPIPVSLRIGDGPVCIKEVGKKAYTLHFKVGRTTATLSARGGVDDPQQETQRLAPMAEQIAESLRS